MSLKVGEKFCLKYYFRYSKKESEFFLVLNSKIDSNFQGCASSLKYHIFSSKVPTRQPKVVFQQLGLVSKFRFSHQANLYSIPPDIIEETIGILMILGGIEVN